MEEPLRRIFLLHLCKSNLHLSESVVFLIKKKKEKNQELTVANYFLESQHFDPKKAFREYFHFSVHRRGESC